MIGGGDVESFPMSRALQDHRKDTAVSTPIGWILGLQHIASESPYQYINMTQIDLERREKTLLYRAILEVSVLEALGRVGISIDGDVRVGKFPKNIFDNFELYSQSAISKLSVKIGGTYVSPLHRLDSPESKSAFLAAFSDRCASNYKTYSVYL